MWKTFTALAVLASLASTTSLKAEEWPTRPLTMINPFAAGGPLVSSLLVIAGFLLPIRALTYAVMRSRLFTQRVLILGATPLALKIIYDKETDSLSDRSRLFLSLELLDASEKIKQPEALQIALAGQ